MSSPVCVCCAEDYRQSVHNVYAHHRVCEALLFDFDCEWNHLTRGRIVREKVHVGIEDYVRLRIALHRGPHRHQLQLVPIVV